MSTLEDKLKELTPAQRAKVEARAQELLQEAKTAQDAPKPADHEKP